MAERPLFDPSRIRVPDAEQGTGSPTSSTLSVRQVNELVRGAINRHIPSTLHVLGEIGDLSRPTSGHCYFTLKDSSSELRCVMWRSAYAKLRFTPQIGLQAIATGGLDVYTPRGTYQLIVSRLEPRGVGALQLAFRQLVEKLRKEGALDPARKRPLPKIPRRVAIVTSPSGAAIRDILKTLERRLPALDILVFPVRVQGKGAAEEIAAALDTLNRHAADFGGIDVAIVGRGGGSLEDLWPFNEEIVARAILASTIPIVSAVGHEVDVSISDLVADVRAATPTAAAELIAPELGELLAMIDRQAARVARSVRHGMDLSRQRLAQTEAREPIARPLSRVQQLGQLVDELERRTRLAIVERHRDARQRLVRAEMVTLRFGAGAEFARRRRHLVQRVLCLRRALDDRLRSRERRLGELHAGALAASPRLRIARLDEHASQVSTRLAAAAQRLIARHGDALRSRIGLLEAYDPRHVLRRGYSITRDARTRRVLRSIAEVREGMRIVGQLADGEFNATAEDPRQPRLFQ
jgi:exodeoxyribonuclease VII large subunit